MSRRRHPKKDVEAALRYAEAAGWTVIEVHRSHRWGQLRCPAGTHQLAVPSTPRDPGIAGRRIRETVDRDPDSRRT